MLNFAYTVCSSAMFVSDVLGVGYGQVFCVQCLFVLYGESPLECHLVSGLRHLTMACSPTLPPREFLHRF